MASLSFRGLTIRFRLLRFGYGAGGPFQSGERSCALRRCVKNSFRRVPGGISPDGSATRGFRRGLQPTKWKKFLRYFWRRWTHDRIGEGSVALAENLGIRSNARNGGAHRGILYLLFPGSGNGRPRTIEEINSEGQKLLQAGKFRWRRAHVSTGLRSGCRRGTSRPMKSRRNSPEEPANEKALREHLNLLSGRGAHLDRKATFAGVPPKLRGVRPAGWVLDLGLAEHDMRIAQWDILEFSRDAKHVSPEWPAGYYGPVRKLKPTATMWDKSLKSFAHDLAEMQKIVQNPPCRTCSGRSPWHWANNLSRGAAGRGSQRLSSGPSAYSSTDPRATGNNLSRANEPFPCLHFQSPQFSDLVCHFKSFQRIQPK